MLRAYMARVLPPSCTVLLVQHDGADREVATVLQSDDAFRCSLALAGDRHSYQTEAASLPSVQAACASGLTVSAVPYSPADVGSGFGDMQLFHEAQGMAAFLVVPLVLAQRDLGALLVMTPQPRALDDYALRLAHELAGQLSQTLYTKICLDEVAAGQQIMARLSFPRAAPSSSRQVLAAPQQMLMHVPPMTHLPLCPSPKTPDAPPPSPARRPTSCRSGRWRR